MMMTKKLVLFEQDILENRPATMMQRETVGSDGYLNITTSFQKNKQAYVYWSPRRKLDKKMKPKEHKQIFAISYGNQSGKGFKTSGNQISNNKTQYKMT